MKIQFLSQPTPNLTWTNDPDVCPACGRKSWNVPQNITLVSHVKEIYWPRIKSLTDQYRGFRFCPHLGCPLVYYHPKIHFVATVNDLKTRVSYKVTEPPIPVCYCVGVLAETIREEIVVKQCCDSLEDIKKYTGARTGKWCHITNPSGRCCGPMVDRVIKAALAERVAEPLKREALRLAQSIPDNDASPTARTVSDDCCSIDSPTSD